MPRSCEIGGNITHAIATSICLFIYLLNKYVWITSHVNHWMGSEATNNEPRLSPRPPREAGINIWWNDNFWGQLSWAWWVRGHLLEEATSEMTRNVKDKEQLVVQVPRGEGRSPWKRGPAEGTGCLKSRRWASTGARGPREVQSRWNVGWDEEEGNQVREGLKGRGSGYIL